MEANLTLDNERTLSLGSSDNDNSPKPQVTCSDAPTHPRIDQPTVRLSCIRISRNVGISELLSLKTDALTPRESLPDASYFRFD
jgi:hypothetical protein